MRGKFMNLNYEILQYFVMKKIVKRKDLEEIFAYIALEKLSPETFMTPRNI